jgi:hypothetical protein
MAFDVTIPRRRRPRGSKVAPTASRYYVSVYRRDPDSHSVAAVAKEVSGRIVGYRIYMEK